MPGSSIGGSTGHEVSRTMGSSRLTLRAGCYLGCLWVSPRLARAFSLSLHMEQYSVSPGWGSRGLYLTSPVCHLLTNGLGKSRLCLPSPPVRPLSSWSKMLPPSHSDFGKSGDGRVEETFLCKQALFQFNCLPVNIKCWFCLLETGLTFFPLHSC